MKRFTAFIRTTTAALVTACFFMPSTAAHAAGLDAYDSYNRLKSAYDSAPTFPQMILIMIGITIGIPLLILLIAKVRVKLMLKNPNYARNTRRYSGSPRNSGSGVWEDDDARRQRAYQQQLFMEEQRRFADETQREFDEFNRQSEYQHRMFEEEQQHFADETNQHEFDDFSHQSVSSQDQGGFQPPQF
jgi:hypothetical protein